MASDLAFPAVRALAGRGQTLAVCESLTGGGIGAAITAVPGSSVVFRGGIIAYATALKAELPGLSAAVIERHGVVSAEVATGMAEAARTVCGSDWAVAVTGVAGPDWQDAQPPGTVYVAVAGPSGSASERHGFTGDRAAVREQTVRAALAAVLRALGDERDGPGGE
ncbi:MAG: CinA family protein [Propionibacteriaceae bacterium]|nr:CinA family protein [Propionibacteriaceae bacterium]